MRLSFPNNTRQYIRKRLHFHYMNARNLIEQPGFSVLNEYSKNGEDEMSAPPPVSPGLMFCYVWTFDTSRLLLRLDLSDSLHFFTITKYARVTVYRFQIQ